MKSIVRKLSLAGVAIYLLTGMLPFSANEAWAGAAKSMRAAEDPSANGGGLGCGFLASAKTKNKDGDDVFMDVYVICDSAGRFVDYSFHCAYVSSGENAPC